MKKYAYLKNRIKHLTQWSHSLREDERRLKGDGFLPDGQDWSKEEQQRYRHYFDAHFTRVVIVRLQARAMMLAYAYLRGVPYHRVETKVHEGNEMQYHSQVLYYVAQIVRRAKALPVSFYWMQLEIVRWTRVKAEAPGMTEAAE